jgi:hypothetical protein
MPKVMANGLYSRTLTLRVRMTERIIRERESVKDRARIAHNSGWSDNTWIVNQVRLKAQL